MDENESERIDAVRVIAPIPDDFIANSIVDAMASQGGHTKIDASSNQQLESAPTYMVVSGPIGEEQLSFIRTTLSAMGGSSDDPLTLLNCNADGIEAEGITDEVAKSLCDEFGITLKYTNVPVTMEFAYGSLSSSTKDGSNFKELIYISEYDSVMESELDSEIKVPRTSERSEQLAEAQGLAAYAIPGASPLGGVPTSNQQVQGQSNNRVMGWR